MNTNTGQSNSQMDHGSAKASLGIATFLQSHLLPQKQQQQTSQTSEPAPQPPTNQETGTDVTQQISGLEERIMGEVGTLRDEIKKVGQPQDQNKELEDLKKEIEQVLNSND